MGLPYVPFERLGQCIVYRRWQSQPAEYRTVTVVAVIGLPTAKDEMCQRPDDAVAVGGGTWEVYTRLLLVLRVVDQGGSDATAPPASG